METMTAATGNTESASRNGTLPPLAVAPLAGLAGAKLLVHLLLANRYGYFRDELYFLDCGRHLDWGYVDHAPLIGLVAKVALLLGGSLPALRIFPAVAGAALVALDGPPRPAARRRAVRPGTRRSRRPGRPDLPRRSTASSR